MTRGGAGGGWTLIKSARLIPCELPTTTSRQDAFSLDFLPLLHQGGNDPRSLESVALFRRLWTVFRRDLARSSRMHDLSRSEW